MADTTEATRRSPRRAAVPWWCTPPGRPSNALVLVGLGALLFATSDPAVDVRGLGLFLLICGPLLLAWLARVIASGVRGVRMYDRRWFVVPALVVAGLFLDGSDLPVRARFELDRAAFEAVRAEVTGPVRTEGPPQRIGGFGVQRLDREGSVLVIVVSTPTWASRGGFVHAPDGTRTEGYDEVVDPDLGLDHLGGGWYWFRTGI